MNKELNETTAAERRDPVQHCTVVYAEHVCVFSAGHAEYNIEDFFTHSGRSITIWNKTELREAGGRTITTYFNVWCLYEGLF